MTNLRDGVPVPISPVAALPLRTGVLFPGATMKFVVGVMLSSFGTFWGAEGAGASWPGGEAALLAIVPGVLLLAIALSSRLRRWAQATQLLESRPTTIVHGDVLGR